MQSRMTANDYQKEYWESGEGSNYHNYGDDPGWRTIMSVMAQYYDMLDCTIYEIACAKGYFVRQARLWQANAYGVDISDYAISQAPADTVAYVQVANAVELPYPSDSADVVCSWEFFEHTPEEEVDQVLSEKIRVLKPGGTIWMKIGIVIPSDHPFAGQEDHDHSHYTVQPREWWEAKFAGAGLQQRKDIEENLDYNFAQRDWVGRFFVWQKPTSVT